MPTRNTRAKRVAKKCIPNLLVDEYAFKANVARNLNLLAGDILSEEEKKFPNVMGLKLLEAVNLLKMEEHMVIVKYYGLIGPEYRPLSLSVIAKEHNTSIKVITALKDSALKRLRITAYKTIYHQEIRAAAEERLMYPKKYVELSFLYKGFKHQYSYDILKKVGINYIHELAECDAHSLANKIDKEGFDMRYCDLLKLIARAQNMVFTEEFLDTVTIEDESGMIYQTVTDLDGKLSDDTIKALLDAGVTSISEFLNMTNSDIQFAVTSNFLYVPEIMKVRKALGYPVRD